MAGNVFNIILMWCASRKPQLVSLFYLVSLGYFLFVVSCGFLIATKSSLLSVVVWVGSNSGKLAALAFLATTFPGILGRFKLKHPLITLGMMFRKQTGIASFYLAFGHALLLYIFPKLIAGLSLFTFLVFEGFGILSLFLLFLLFATSNRWMRQYMGVWWKRLHSLVYLIYWTIFLHLILRDLDWLSALIGVSAVLEVISLVYARVTKKVFRSPEGLL